MDIDLPAQGRTPWRPPALAVRLLHGAKRGRIDLPAQKRRPRILDAGIGQSQAASVFAPFLDQAYGIDALGRPPVPLAPLGTLRLASQRRTAMKNLPFPVKNRQPSAPLLNDDPHALPPDKAKVVKNV